MVDKGDCVPNRNRSRTKMSFGEPNRVAPECQSKVLLILYIMVAWNSSPFQQVQKMVNVTPYLSTGSCVLRNP